MVNEIYGFLIKFKYDDIDKNYEEVAIDILKHNADKALYVAKGEGGNSIYVYDITKGIGQYTQNGLWIPYNPK